MAEILNVTAVTEKEVSVSKGVGSLIFYINKKFPSLTQEQVSISIERNGQSNIEITQGFVSLKRFILAATYGDDAISNSPEFATVAVVELCENGAIFLGPSDKLKIALKGLDAGAHYVIDGHEESTTSDDIYMYEEKIVPLDQMNYDVNVAHYDILVLDDNADITEVNITHDNQKVTKHSLRELRAVSQDIDPVAYIEQTGAVNCSIAGYIQIPTKAMLTINVRKATGSEVRFFMRKDVELVQLGLI